MPEPAEPHPDDDMFVVDGLSFRDLDHDRRLAPYEDWRLPIDDRVADLVQRMTIEEKAGKTPSP
jgi:beta-glucosidase